MLSLIPLPYRIGAVLLLLAAVVSFGYNLGASSVQGDWDAQKAVDLVAAATIKEKQAAISIKVDEAAQKVITETRIIYKTINREIPVYVTKNADSACAINNGFVSLHDAAAKAVIPSPPGDLNDAPAGITLSAATETVTDNYGTCNETRKQLIELQGWIKMQREVTGN